LAAAVIVGCVLTSRGDDGGAGAVELFGKHKLNSQERKFVQKVGLSPSKFRLPFGAREATLYFGSRAHLVGDVWSFGIDWIFVAGIVLPGESLQDVTEISCFWAVGAF